MYRWYSFYTCHHEGCHISNIYVLYVIALGNVTVLFLLKSVDFCSKYSYFNI